MRKRQREKIVDITTTILEVLFRFGGATSDALSGRKEFYNEINQRGFDRITISNRVRELISAGNIEALEESGTKSIRLTRKGKIKCLEQACNNETDGKWRFVSFDIPEELKTQRLAFTRSLRRIGYKPVQKSLWVCPYNKADETQLLCDELRINEYVANFKVEKIDIENHLRELFEESY